MPDTGIKPPVVSINPAINIRAKAIATGYGDASKYGRLAWSIVTLPKGLLRNSTKKDARTIIIPAMIKTTRSKGSAP